MSASEDLRARAQQIQARDRPAPVDETAPAPPRSSTRRVRQTFDLTALWAHRFAAWRLETALALDRSQVTTQDAMTAVVEVILDDEVVARRVRARLEQRST